MPPSPEPLSSLSTNTIQERKRATAPFATAPARRPAKDAIDSDDEQPSSSGPHSSGPHSGSSIFPPLPLYKEGYENGAGDYSEADEQILIQSQLQSQEGTADQGQNERHEQEEREDGDRKDGEQGDGPHTSQTQQSQPSPYRLGGLWELMTEEERRGATEDEGEAEDEDRIENENIPAERPKKRRRRTKAQVDRPEATAATGRPRRGKALGVTNVLEQMMLAMGKAQKPEQPTENVQQQQEEEEEGQEALEEALEGQEVEIQPEPGLQKGEIAEEELPDVQVEEQQQPPQDEPAVADDGVGEEGDYEEEEQGEAVDLTAQRTPAPDSPPQQQEAAAPTPSRASRRLQGREPTTGNDDAENEAEDEANGTQPPSQQTARTIQETPQGTGGSVGTNSQQQAGVPDGNGDDINETNGNGDDGNDADDDVVVVDTSAQQPESRHYTKQPVKVALSIETLNAVVELMSSAGWTGKATWKMSLNWQCMQPGQFGPGPFTVQAKDLLRHLAILSDRYVQVPRPNSMLLNEIKKYDMRIQREYLRDHEAGMEELLRTVDATINIICHDALQPMTTYAADMTREAARFRWLLADDLIEYAIPKTVELLESVYAMGGSLPLREVGVAAVYLPRNTVQLIHATWYAARRVAGWIARLENALAWELGYRDYRRMDGDRVVDVEDPNAGNGNNNNYSGYDDTYPPRAWDNRPAAEAARNAQPASAATKRKDRSRLKPLLNRLEDELGLAWVNLERGRMAQEEEIQAENADEDGDGGWVDVDTAAGRPSQRTRQTGQIQRKRKRGRPRKEQQPSQAPPRRQQTEPGSDSESGSEPEAEANPGPEGTPPEVRWQRAVRERMASWDSDNDDDDQDYVTNSHGDVVGELGQRVSARRAEHVDHPGTGAYELRVDHVGSSMQTLSSQPQWPTRNRYMRIREEGPLDDDDDDINNTIDNINNDDDDLLMTTAIATAAAAPVSQPSPLVASVEQATQDVVEAVEVEEIEVEEEEAAEAEQVADLVADAMEVDADMPAVIQVEAPATQTADIPTPEPTPTPTPTPGPAQADVPATQPASEPGSQPAPQPATQPIPTTNTSVSPAATPTVPATQGNYTVAEQKLILRRLRALKGTAQLGLISLAAELGRDVLDVARRTEKLKSEVRAQALQANKPVPRWAQAGYTIR